MTSEPSTTEFIKLWDGRHYDREVLRRTFPELDAYANEPPVFSANLTTETLGIRTS